MSVIAVTDKEKGALRPLAEKNGWPCFTVPDGIGGRFSVFSQVGLVFAMLSGIDIRDFLAGARMTEEACRSLSLSENPALQLAVRKYLARENHGVDAEIIMPYGDRSPLARLVVCTASG